MADAEVFERALSLGAPQLVRGDLDHTEAVSLFSRGGHWTSPSARCRGFSFECAKPPCGELATVRIPCIPHMVSRRLGGGFHGQLLVPRGPPCFPPRRHFSAGEWRRRCVQLPSSYERETSAASKSGLRTPNSDVSCAMRARPRNRYMRPLKGVPLLRTWASSGESAVAACVRGIRRGA